MTILFILLTLHFANNSVCTLCLSRSVAVGSRPNMLFSPPESYVVINVSDYEGATASERIQKALDDVPPEGATVFIPDGIWEAYNLTAKSKTILTGTDGTVIRRPANTTTPFLTFTDQTDFAIFNLKFEGQNITEATGILIVNGIRFQISNNTFRNIDRTAVHVTGVCEDFTIDGNSLENSNGAPILIFGSPGTRQIRRFAISNNTLLDSFNNGKIGVAFAAEGTISANHIANCTYGVGTRCVSNITIESNIIEDCTSYGIYLGTQPADLGSSNIEISGNYISNSRVGIARYYGSGSMENVTLRNNTLVYNEQSDIYADFQGVFVNNTLTSKDKLTLLTIPSKFMGNSDINHTTIIPTDITNDGTVDMRDVGKVASLYGTSPDTWWWDPDADIIQDLVVDMRDIGYVAYCFCNCF